MSEAAALPPAPAERPPYKRTPELPDPKPVPGFDSIKKEVSPFDDADWRVRIYNWCGFLLRVLLIAGAVVTALQYFAARDEKRVERALELVTLWEDPQYQDAQKALNARLAALKEQVEPLLGANPTPQQIQIASRRIGSQAMTARGGTMPVAEFGGHFDKIVYFLNRLSFCVQGNICSREVSDAYFLDFAKSFWQYFGGYIQDKRKQGFTTFAQPIEEYVKASGGAAPGASLGVPATPSDTAPAS